MSTKKIYEMHAEVCKAMAHPLRIEIIDILQKKEHCFSEILEITGGIKSNLSQHLSIMVDKGILNSRRDSRCNYFSLSSLKVSKATALMREILEEDIHQKRLAIKKLVNKSSLH